MASKRKPHMPSPREKLAAVFLVAAPALLALLLARRRSTEQSEEPESYIFRHPSLAKSSRGKLIFVQRHGQTSKNLANPPVRREVKASIAAAQKAGMDTYRGVYHIRI